MNRRKVLKGLLVAPVVAAVGLGAEKQWGLITNVKASPYAVYDLGEKDFTVEAYIYYQPNGSGWTMEWGRGGTAECITWSRETGFTCTAGQGEFKVDAKVGHQTYKRVTMFNCRLVKVVA